MNRRIYLVRLFVFLPGVYRCLSEHGQGHLFLRGNRIRDQKAKAITVEMAQEKVIPSCDIVPIVQEFMAPRHAQFKQKSEWSLFNSVTEVCKKYTPARAQKCYTGLAKFFSLN